MIRFALGVLHLDHEHDVDDDDMVRAHAHVALHAVHAAATNCWVRVFRTDSRAKWRDVLIEYGCQPESTRESLVERWQPGMVTAVAMADIPDPTDLPETRERPKGYVH